MTAYSSYSRRAPLFSRKEIGIVGGCLLGLLLLIVVSVAGGLMTLLYVGPVVVLALIVGSIAASVWLFFKFGFIVVREGTIAAHEELERRRSSSTR